MENSNVIIDTAQASNGKMSDLGRMMGNMNIIDKVDRNFVSSAIGEHFAGIRADIQGNALNSKLDNFKDAMGVQFAQVNEKLAQCACDAKVAQAVNALNTQNMKESCAKDTQIQTLQFELLLKNHHHHGGSSK